MKEDLKWPEGWERTRIQDRRVAGGWKKSLRDYESSLEKELKLNGEGSRMQVVEFVESSHTLSVDGKVLPSVTKIIASAGLLGNAENFYSEESAWRGSIVHRLAERHDLGEDDGPPPLEQHEGYLFAWKHFRQDSGFVPEIIERPLADVKLGLAGILDRFGMINGAPAIVDLKTGAIAKWVALQTSAYAHLCRVNAIDVRPISSWKRFAVRLQADGKYSVKEFKGLQDWQVFSAALCLHNWKLSN